MPWWGWIPVVVFPLGMVSPLVVHLICNRLYSEKRQGGSTLTLLTVDPPSWRGLSEFEKASRRWAQRNAEHRAAGCPCGQPATEVEYDGRNMGSVPVETWTCAKHKGAAGWNGTQPTWARPSPCSACTGYCSRSGPISGPVNTWYCPTREDS